MVCKDGGDDDPVVLANQIWADDPNEINRSRRNNTRTPSIYETDNDLDDDWMTPLTKIVNLSYDHESWQHAQELLDAPSPECRKIGDEVQFTHMGFKIFCIPRIEY